MVPGHSNKIEAFSWYTLSMNMGGGGAGGTEVGISKQKQISLLLMSISREQRCRRQLQLTEISNWNGIEENFLGNKEGKKEPYTCKLFYFQMSRKREEVSCLTIGELIFPFRAVGTKKKSKIIYHMLNLVGGKNRYLFFWGGVGGSRVDLLLRQNKRRSRSIHTIQCFFNSPPPPHLWKKTDFKGPP